jgi:transposase
MAQLDKNDLAQMNEDYFKSLEKERLVEVAKNLHQLATDLWEKQQQNSENSSQLTEYVLVGAFFATFIASLIVRYRMSRTKIQEFFKDWTNTELSIGTIDRCIRETGIACVPVVEELVKQLQQADILHLDETHWYEQGKLHWLWVAVTNKTAVFHLGSRRKEELSHLVTEAFLGWLISDGYAAYRSHPKRQRCLAHLIRKAIAITCAINQKAAQIGQWILDDLRELMGTIASNSRENRWHRKLLARLIRVCHLGKKADHHKLQALASEILNDWDAVVAFVKNPELPPTNNEAERALRHAVIARNIGYGTRTREGSLAYRSLLSVIETCRLRDINPWTYIASVLALARQGLAPPPFPVGN